MRKFYVGLLLSFFTCCIWGQSKDDLQELLDSKGLLRSDEVTVVDLSNYSSLERTRPLYVRNGGKFKFINGTLLRTEHLKDSAMLVITNNSSVDLGDGAELSGAKEYNEKYMVDSELELVLVDHGKLSISSGRIHNVFSNGNSYLFSTSYYNRRAVTVSSKGIFEMTGGIIVESTVENNGQMIFKGGHIGCVRSYNDFEMSGDAWFYDVCYEKDKIIKLSSALKNEMTVWLNDLAIMSTAPGASPKYIDYDGAVLMTSNGYEITEADLQKIRLQTNRKYKLILENSHVLIRKADDEINTQKDFIEAIENATGTCESPTEIKVSGEILLDSKIEIKNKGIKLTGGGTLKRASGYLGELFVLNGACVTLENINFDGNAFAFSNYSDSEILKSPIVLYNQSVLKINEGTLIKNHRVNDNHAGLICAYSASMPVHSCSVIMNGGQITNNIVPLSDIISNTDPYLSDFYVKINGGIISNNRCLSLVVANDVDILDVYIVDNNTNNSIIRFETGWIQNFENGIPGFISVSSNVILQNTTNVSSFILAGENAFIYRFGEFKNKINIKHSSYYENKLITGTAIVKGWQGYELTEKDLSMCHYESDKWELELKDNAFVLKEKGSSSQDEIKNGDDLQDFLDGLVEKGTTGTEKEPIDIILGGGVNDGITLGVFPKIRIYVNMHIRIVGGTFVRGTGVDASYDGTMFDVAEGASVVFENVTIDGGKRDFPNSLIKAGGTVYITGTTIIKNGSGNGLYGGAVYIPIGGRVVMSGGTITENYGTQGAAFFNNGTLIINGGLIYGNSGTIGVIVNNGGSSFTLNGGSIYDNTGLQMGGIFNGDGSTIFINNGIIDGNNVFDFYTWVNIIINGGVQINGPLALLPPAKLLITSKLEYTIYLTIIVNVFVNGTVIAEGHNGYKLTEQDLSHIYFVNEKWELKLQDNTIVLVEKSPATAIEDVSNTKVVYVENNNLVLKGQIVGEPYYIYSINGHLVHKGLIDSDYTQYLLKEKGIMIVKCGNKTYKVVNK
ncbi:MAG: hypothetical protein E7085_05925 [Parabacteroides distasonis]|nr:hypothetical protein [Parabacteroides distasonis]